jgi:hypothetical protein
MISAVDRHGHGHWWCPERRRAARTATASVTVTRDDGLYSVGGPALNRSTERICDTSTVYFTVN